MAITLRRAFHIYEQLSMMRKMAKSFAKASAMLPQISHFDLIKQHYSCQKES